LILGTAIVGWSSLLASIFFLGGVQLVSIGILGEYQAHLRSGDAPAVELAQTSFDGVRLVDFGCGPGGLLKGLAQEHRLAEVLGVDGDPRMVDAVRARGLPAHLVDLQATFTLPFRPNQWVCADVLGHLEDDRAALTRMREHCEPGSLLAISVPAHAWLFSTPDRGTGVSDSRTR
jgi:trans-aconitate methyltransferase